MPSIFDSPELSQVRSEAQTAASAYSQASQAGLTLPDMLREALTKKFSTSNPLLQQREGAVKTYMTESAAAPLAVTPQSAGGTAPVTYTPLEQAALIGGRRAAALAPLTSLNALLGLQQTGLENVIGETGRAYQGVVEGMKGQAEAKRQTYTDLLTELSKKADEAYREKQLAQELKIAEMKQEAKPTLSASERRQSAFADEVLRQIDTLTGKYGSEFEGTGPVSGTWANILKLIPGKSKDNKLLSIQSDVGPVRESILNLISGANVSPKEAERVMSWIPDINKSPEENKRNLASLRNWAVTKYETITNETYSSPVKTPQAQSENPQIANAKTLLSKAGYSPQQISEYLKLKGLQ